MSNADNGGRRWPPRPRLAVAALAACALALSSCGAPSAKAQAATALRSLGSSPYLQATMRLSTNAPAKTSAQQAIKKMLTASDLTVDVSSVHHGVVLSAAKQAVNVELALNVAGYPALRFVEVAAPKAAYFRLDLAPVEPYLPARDRTVASDLGLFLGGKWFSIPASEMARFAHANNAAARGTQAAAHARAVLAALGGALRSAKLQATGGGKLRASGTLASLQAAIEKALGHKLPAKAAAGTWTASMVAPSGRLASTSLAVQHKGHSADISATFAHRAVTVKAPAHSTTLPANLFSHALGSSSIPTPGTKAG